MGCWNGTCFISNLPIRHGDEVVGFVISYDNFKDEVGYSGSCYSEAYARPLGLPFFGTYDDYGGIEDIKESIATKYLCHKFNEKDIAV
jgi:hypothetical protein